MSVKYSVRVPSMAGPTVPAKLEYYDSFDQALNVALPAARFTSQDVHVHMIETEDGYTFYDKIITVHPHPKLVR